ncbi:serine hydrolase domain-containing protein [Paenarthrobacter sp. NPDC056912]|uniref:serine hydrolase domain-containing protein n=1 Tax=Paenarthrobacter sp. NPDC056912 TaxID=3345965 RepID=UPI00366A7701
MTQQTMSTSEVTVSGHVGPGFEAVEKQFEDFLGEDPGFSAQLAVYHRGAQVIDLTGGPALSPESVTAVFSCTKGAAAMVMALLVEDGRLDLDEKVVRYWPEFAPHGKHRMTVRQLLSHQAGLVNVKGGMAPEELTDSPTAARLLADARPLWQPGAGFGYHGLTIGTLMEELVRRITGRTLQDEYEDRIRGPRGIDFYVGLPEDLEPRYRPVAPMRLTEAQEAEAAANTSTLDGYFPLALNSPNHMPDIIDGFIAPNRREVRAAGPAGAGGVSSARGLARLYAAALGHIGDRLLSEATIEAMSQVQIWGRDLVLGFERSLGVVFMKPDQRMNFGSYRAFGHDGAGGALGFADPEYDLGFGYVPYPLQYPGGADPRAIKLSQLVRGCIRSLER